MVRRISLVLAALAALGVVAPAGASAARAECATDWGSREESALPSTRGQLTDVRAGQHECWDRLVLDFAGENDGYHVAYVDEVHEDGSGEPVPLRGGAKLVVVAASPAHDENGVPTYTYDDRAELVDVTGHRTFRQVAWANSFEGRSTVGLGVRARLPFRVSTLPGRLVVDVAHTW